MLVPSVRRAAQRWAGESVARRRLADLLNSCSRADALWLSYRSSRASSTLTLVRLCPSQIRSRPYETDLTPPLPLLLPLSPQRSRGSARPRRTARRRGSSTALVTSRWSRIRGASRSLSRRGAPRRRRRRRRALAPSQRARTRSPSVAFRCCVQAMCVIGCARERELTICRRRSTPPRPPLPLPRLPPCPARRALSSRAVPRPTTTRTDSSRSSPRSTPTRCARSPFIPSHLSEILTFARFCAPLPADPWCPHYRVGGR